MVHIDLIAGLSSKEIAVDFIQKYTKADGIITTKPALIKRAKELGLYTILRLFVIDSMAYSNIEHQLRTAKPDLIEGLSCQKYSLRSANCPLFLSLQADWFPIKKMSWHCFRLAWSAFPQRMRRFGFYKIVTIIISYSIPQISEPAIIKNWL